MHTPPLSLPDGRRHIFATVVGSRLYGIDRPDSDWDVKGVYLPTALEVMAGTAPDQISWGNGGTGAGKVEGVYYSPRRFLRLVAKGNPTLLEVAFTRPTDAGPGADSLLADARLLVSRAATAAFVGYAQHQRHLVARSHNAPNPASVRAPDIDRVGYDAKAAAHCLRIATQLVELHTTGRLTPRLAGRDLDDVRRVRAGEVSYDEAMDLIDTRLREANNLDLPGALHPLPDSVAPGLLDDLVAAHNWQVVRPYAGALDRLATDRLSGLA